MCRLAVQHARCIASGTSESAESFVNKIAPIAGRDAAAAISSKLTDAERTQLLLSFKEISSSNANPPPAPADEKLPMEDYKPMEFSQMWRLAVRCALPFFGFGICDNLIMISVGDAIDSAFGVTLGFSTMIAAGLGQAVSDGSGITIQGFIENRADHLGLPKPHLTPAQEAHWTTGWYMQFFRTLGIVLGCLFGLIPVIMFDTGNRPRLSDELLKTLPEEQRAKLRAKQTACNFREGDYLMQFGEEAPAIFTVISGELRVIGRNDFGEPTEIGTHRPGESTGVVEIVFGHRCVADVIVVSPTARCVMLMREDIEEVEGGMSSMRKTVQDFVTHDENFLPYRMRFMHSDRTEEDDDDDADEPVAGVNGQANSVTADGEGSGVAAKHPMEAANAVRQQRKKDRKSKLDELTDGCIDVYYNNQALKINEWVLSKRKDEVEDEVPSAPSSTT